MIEVKDIMKQAAKFGACNKSRKVSDWSSLAWLFFTPQGREFCELNEFPSLTMFEQIKEHGVKKYGFYINEGDIKLENPDDCAIIGRTYATLEFEGCNRAHRVFLMHGARARISAKDYAVIHLIKTAGCEAFIDQDDTSVILE